MFCGQNAISELLPILVQTLVARAIRNAIRANRFARIIRNRNPYFYSASRRFARITRISDSRESGDSRESCESIRANHATKVKTTCFWARDKTTVFQNDRFDNPDLRSVFWHPPDSRGTFGEKRPWSAVTPHGLTPPPSQTTTDYENIPCARE